MDSQALKEVFLSESEELLADLEHGLVTLEDRPRDPEVINTIFRAAHTLKSNAGMVGYDSIVRLAHVAESLLSQVRDRKLRIDRSLISLLLRAVDCFKSQLGQAAAGAEVVLDELGLSTLAGLQQAMASDAAPPAPEPAHLRLFRVDISLDHDVLKSGQEPAYLIADLAELGDIISTAAVLDRLPRFEALDPERCYVEWRIVLRTERSLSDVRAVFVFVDTSQITITEVTKTHSHLDQLADKRLGELLVEEGHAREQDIDVALQRQKRLGEVLVDLGAVEQTTIERVLERQRLARQQRRSSSIRIDVEKLDRLVNLAGELSIAISQANQVMRQPDATSAARIASAEALEQIGRDLQNQVLSVRMVPIEETFGRFKRVVRDLSEELGKHVVLETFGNDTELDKSVSEQIADPIKHMVRNAIGHGIESPQDRVRAGKGDTGRLQLRAAQRQGHVIIEVTDDGRGIDPERIYQKARQLGIVSERENYTERQLLDYIFHPGLSTASEVSAISGRGVGLDVVKRNVTDLHGQVEVDSRLGQGTTFRIKLPLTLAIIEGMHVRVGSDTMTFPLTSVVELLSPDSNPLRTIEGKGELVDVRGEYLPVVRLGEVLDCSDRDCAGGTPTIVVVESSTRRFGIIVDRIIGMEQAVVKPLRSTFGIVASLFREYKKLEAVSGATILGDGNVALILDVPGIERMAFGDVR